MFLVKNGMYFTKDSVDRMYIACRTAVGSGDFPVLSASNASPLEFISVVTLRGLASPGTLATIWQIPMNERP